MSMKSDKGLPTWFWAWFVVIAVAIILGVYACGPTALCVMQGGEPAQNLLGAKWCELDGNNRPSEGDVALEW